MVPSVKCAAQFDAADLRVGQSLFNADRVTEFEWRNRQARVGVREATGTMFEINLDFELAAEGTIRVHCDCARYQQGWMCPHIWAALLELEETKTWDEKYACLEWARIRRMPDRAIWDVQRMPPHSKQRKDLEAALALHQNADKPAETSDWSKALSQFQRAVNQEVMLPQLPMKAPAVLPLIQHWFVIAIDEQVASHHLRLTLYRTKRMQSGQMSKPARQALLPEEVERISDSTERTILALCGAKNEVDEDGFSSDFFSSSRRGRSTFELPIELYDIGLPLLDQTGRLGWAMSAENQLDEVHQLRWQPGESWQLAAAIQPIFDEDNSSDVIAYEVVHGLERGTEKATLREVVSTVEAGLVVFAEAIAPIRPTDVPLIRALARAPISFRVARDDLDTFLSRYAQLPVSPEIHFHPSMRVAREQGQPKGRLVVTQSRNVHPIMVNCDVKFLYESAEIGPGETRSWTWDAARGRMLFRDLDAEQVLINRFLQHPVELARYRDPSAPGLWQIAAKALPDLTIDLTKNGWIVIASGRRLRMASEFQVHVSSGVDWFDVHAEIEFDGIKVSLPALLAAIRNKQDFVILDDGSHGILPEEWLRRYAGLADLLKSTSKTKKDDESLRIPHSQALLLEAMLAQHQLVDADRNYHKLISNLHGFEGIEPVEEPSGFKGTLRPYQREGLGWFGFLRDFGFGGCLADDMGLGKTVQVLAMLQSRRVRRLKKNECRAPSLVVVPKSLIFNWIDESARFAPQLRVVSYHGTSRKELLADLSESDLYVTTYGTMRQDIEKLKDIHFDYVILDEAQAIKNHQSQVAKASRLLQSQHRLAMTGTPVENHLVELWSLFQFLNPGMIPNSDTFSRCQGATPEAVESLKSLAKALRPLILRRTKEQVLTDLPEKTEQTLFCDMTPKQKVLYNELRDHYRLHLGDQIKQLGLNRAKIHVLEALLRLRQAACDPRLIDSKKKIVGAKMEVLLEQIESVIDEGHKALIFSQFTSLLSLVRKELDARKVTFEYLDGQTSNRAQRVKRFQSDKNCPLFLISLKAGGHGLNLTAADYVFILDPWWNPAVEAQAIDRAHRIGQTNRVMAYRIICKDTVEEKILRLQQSKRDLADAIISENSSLIRDLSADDLAMLLE